MKTKSTNAHTYGREYTDFYVQNEMALQRIKNTGTSSAGSMSICPSIRQTWVGSSTEDEYVVIDQRRYRDKHTGYRDKTNERIFSRFSEIKTSFTNDSLTNHDENKDVSVITNLWKRIEKLNCWKDEDIEVGPTDEVLNKARNLIPNLVDNELMPFRITPSIDEGVCLVFQKDNILAYLELYNDGDIGLIAEDYVDKRILENVDLGMENIIPTLRKILKLA